MGAKFSTNVWNVKFKKEYSVKNSLVFGWKFFWKKTKKIFWEFFFFFWGPHFYLGFREVAFLIPAFLKNFVDRL